MGITPNRRYTIDYRGILAQQRMFVKDYFILFQVFYSRNILDFLRPKWYDFRNGEMSERFKEPVLKTGDGATHRGFESHSLRQKERQLSTESCRSFCSLLYSLFTFLSSLRSRRYREELREKRE